MRRASYRAGVEWIARNDETGDNVLDEKVIAEYISTMLLADLFGLMVQRVAYDIVKFRKKENMS